MINDRLFLLSVNMNIDNNTILMDLRNYFKFINDDIKFHAILVDKRTGYINLDKFYFSYKRDGKLYKFSNKFNTSNNRIEYKITMTLKGTDLNNYLNISIDRYFQEFDTLLENIPMNATAALDENRVSHYVSEGEEYVHPRIISRFVILTLYYKWPDIIESIADNVLITYESGSLLNQRLNATLPQS